MNILKTNIPEIDQENEYLFKAAQYLEIAGNHPNVTASELYEVMADDDIDMAHEDFPAIATAAIAIETMLTLHMIDEEEEIETVH
jgi:hypothetical protein